jgi:CubicO group peptidase (beta-lactamase class C family)
MTPNEKSMSIQDTIKVSIAKRVLRTDLQTSLKTNKPAIHHPIMDLLNTSVRQHVEALMDTYHLPGLSISICQNDTITSAGFGVSSRESNKAATADTLYDIASSSKSLTAAAVALLVEDDDNYPEVQWTTPLHELLPDDFVMPTPELTKRVTVEDVLSHRTGMAL